MEIKKKKLTSLNEIKVTFNNAMKKILRFKLLWNRYCLPRAFKENNVKQKTSGEMLKIGKI